MGFSYLPGGLTWQTMSAVRLTVELATKPSPVESVRRWRGNRIQIDPHLAGEIALSPEFHPDED